jgi:eukaryotic-like serine/threonine-protein kinase
MNYLKLLTGNSWRGLFLHLVVIMCLGLGFIWYFYNVYLPKETLHGESITLPSIENMNIEEAQKLLASKGLEVVIKDTVYSPKHPKSSVVTQRPKALKEVKLGRKVYVDVNRSDIPTITLSSKLCRENGGLIRTDLGTAQITASNLNLVPVVMYVDSVLSDYVYAAEIKGQRIKPNMHIPINTEIVLLTGNGVDPRLETTTP